ncbi:MAG: copper chaperone PCu(A)C [Steroidobacteraceae bacterium]
MKRRTAILGALALACMQVAVGSEPAQLVVRDAWARATPPGAAVAAVYLTIVGGTRADRLLGASTEAAAMTQIHAVTESQGMSRMRETDGVAVPAGATVVLAPQGLHLMLMNLAQPLAVGESIELALTFEQAGRRTVTVKVVPPDQPAAPAAH